MSDLEKLKASLVANAQKIGAMPAGFLKKPGIEWVLADGTELTDEDVLRRAARMTDTTDVTQALAYAVSCLCSLRKNYEDKTGLWDDVSKAITQGNAALAHAPPMVADEGLVERVRSLRSEMELRFTGTFAEKAVNTLDAVAAALTRPAIEAEVRAETERCAKIVDAHWKGLVGKGPCGRGSVNTARIIAEEIRSPSSGEADGGVGWRDILTLVPELGCGILAWDKSCVGEPYIACWTKGGWFDGVVYRNPTHWRPLPTPPSSENGA